MGGEPTFVGIDEPESPQWNIDALGPIKRSRGLALIRCSARAESRPGAMLHYGQGKWYPGEPLPRWALSCYWRADGVPVWEDVDSHRARRSGLRFWRRRMRCRFMEALTRRLQVSSENIAGCVQPGGESAEPAGVHLAAFAGGSRRAIGLVEPVVVSAAGASGADGGRFADWLSHSDRVDAVGCAG